MALRLPEPNQFGLVLLLCGDPKHTGVTDLPGMEPFEQCVGIVGCGNDLTVLEGHPLPLKPVEHLG